MEDRYEILDVVARGAMATVWRARDVRLDRIVAIKRPHAGSDAGSTDSAFTAAALSAAAVTHPSLITIFDTGTDATGPYLVMEFVDGPTLAEMGGASDDAAVLGAEIASGLAALHSAGIVHRAVRPSNILLGPTGPKLTDFGTSRTLDTASDSTPTTPRVTAPEVLAGGEPSMAADVYSLGVVLSWLTAQAAPSPELTAIIDQAKSEDLETRVTAATLTERLTKLGAPPPTPISTAPVGAAPSTDDATHHFDAAPVAVEPTETKPSSGRRWVAAAIALLALIVVAVALTRDDDPAPVAGDTTIPTTTVAPEGTDTPDTTVPEEEGGVFNTVRVFVTFIRETPGDVVTSSGAEEIISDVVDGVSEAIRGNVEAAESNLEEAVETVQEEIDSPSVVDRAIELITRLARQLGLDVDRVVEPSE